MVTKINPYLVTNGNGQGSSASCIPKNWSSHLMISDTFPGSPYQVGNHLSIAIMINEADQAKENFNKLEEDGEVKMQLQETFWGPLYGQVQDKFGVLWQVSMTNEKL